MQSQKILPCAALAIGSLIALIGISLAVMYVLEAIIARIGEADQSLLFWYLPILFIGIIGIFIGLGVGIWGAILLWKIRQEEVSPEN
jgi:hypothetical protein